MSGSNLRCHRLVISLVTNPMIKQQKITCNTTSAVEGKYNHLKNVPYSKKFVLNSPLACLSSTFLELAFFENSKIFLWKQLE